MGFRFLHLADVHLETSFGGSPATRERLRAATLEAFASACDYAIEQRLHAVLAAGDLYDDDVLSLRTEAELVRQIRRAWPNVFRHAQLIPAVDYIRANRLRTLLIQEFDAAIADIRAIVHPSFASGLLTTTNLTGHPTFVAPCGFNDDGTPFSISFTGQLDGETDLLALARAWQSVTDHHAKHPEL